MFVAFSKKLNFNETPKVNVKYFKSNRQIVPTKPNFTGISAMWSSLNSLNSLSFHDDVITRDM